MADENGRFQLDRSRVELPDTFTLLAFNGGRSSQVAVAKSQSEVLIQLRAAATLRGHLAAGPVQSFVVEARPVGDAGGFGGAAQSREFTGDYFELRDLPGQPVRVVVTTGDGRSASQDVLLAPEMAKDIEVDLQPLGTVFGRLLDSSSHLPIQDAFVFPDTPRSVQGDGSRSDAEGRFTLQVPSGDHILHCFVPRHKGLNRRFTLLSSQQLDLGDVPLEPQTVQPGTVGVTLGADSALRPVVSSVVPDGPAEKSGVRVADRLTTVDGVQVSGVSEASRRLSGAPGTQVQIIVQRGAAAEVFSIMRAVP